MKMEQTECPETSAYTFQKPGNRPQERIQQFSQFLGVTYIGAGPSGRAV